MDIAIDLYDALIESNERREKIGGVSPGKGKRNFLR
jgi:hypothetical protein